MGEATFAASTLEPRLGSSRFLLGIGCQKGGTSWLAHYLRGDPKVRFGARKEMHVLDAHFLAELRDWHSTRIDRNLAQMKRLKARGALSPELRRQLKADNLAYRQARSLVGDLDAYAHYFARRIEGTNDAALAVDLTPAYCLLRSGHWRIVRRSLSGHGLDLRILFVLRDPVARLESAYRMFLRNEVRFRAREGTDAAPGTTSVPKDDLMAFSLRDMNLERSRLDLTIEAVEAVFPTASIHYEFFETMFEEAPIRRVMAFLGLDYRPPDFAKKINESPPSAGVDPSDLLRLRDLLAPAYEFCAARFGRDRLHSIWPNA